MPLPRVIVHPSPRRRRPNRSTVANAASAPPLPINAGEAPGLCPSLHAAAYSPSRAPTAARPHHQPRRRAPLVRPRRPAPRALTPALVRGTAPPAPRSALLPFARAPRPPVPSRRRSSAALLRPRHAAPCCRSRAPRDLPWPRPSRPRPPVAAHGVLLPCAYSTSSAALRHSGRPCLAGAGRNPHPVAGLGQCPVGLAPARPCLLWPGPLTTGPVPPGPMTYGAHP
nr:predicted GPI-anchored protein 58 [Aegilops tauschii subsp. strangulata]